MQEKKEIIFSLIQIYWSLDNVTAIFVYEIDEGVSVLHIDFVSKMRHAVY